jgi:hypothetical protein
LTHPSARRSNLNFGRERASLPRGANFRGQAIAAQRQQERRGVGVDTTCLAVKWRLLDTHGAAMEVGAGPPPSQNVLARTAQATTRHGVKSHPCRVLRYNRALIRLTLPVLVSVKVESPIHRGRAGQTPRNAGTGKLQWLELSRVKARPGTNSRIQPSSCDQKAAASYP